MSIKQNLRLLAAFLFRSVAFNASAGFNEGLTAEKQGDLKTEFSEWKPLAEQGNAFAQYYLGMMYEYGQGVEQDYGQALAWYWKAADQGNADAQSKLGLMYSKGRGVAQDYGQALAWHRKAAEQGNADAQYNLGVKYQFGRGVPQNDVVAYALYNLSASIDSSDDKATNNQNSLVEHMTPAQVAAGQVLTREMSVKGNLLKAVDQYRAHR